MIEEKITFGSDSKSFLRKKWDLLFKKIAIRRIPSSLTKSNQVINIENEEQLKDLINPKNKENNKKWKVVVIFIPLNNFINLVGFFNNLDEALNENTKIIVNYYSILWKPLFAFFAFFKLIKNYNKSLFFSKNTLNIFLKSANFEVSKNLNNFFIPFKIPIISKFFSIIFNFLPFINYFNITDVCYLRKKIYKKRQNQKLSLIVPCKNEEGNIKKIVSEARENLKFPYEIIFIDDQSTDDTLKIMENCKSTNDDIEIKIAKGLGNGKAIAINEGIKIADSYYSIIFDADMTVNMTDVNLFYSTISNGFADLINGSRLVYKPYSGAMKKLNFLGNTFFAKLASYITGEKITDTLCGSKCFITRDYEIFNEFKEKNKINDIWGDFNILYASNFYGFKCIDLPVRYYERLEGETKMKKRLYFFFNMLNTSLKAFIRFKINFEKN